MLKIITQVFCPIKLSLIAICLCAVAPLTYSHNTHYHPDKDWAKLANGEVRVGKSHGEIAVAQNGMVYVSLMSSDQDTGGIAVFAPDGTKQRDIPNAPTDFHGFVIRKDKKGEEYIFGASLNGAKIIKMDLNGQVAFSIDAEKAIPSTFHNKNEKQPALKLTGIDIDSEDNIYVVDGYGLDFIHKFDRTGKYLLTFGGREAPYHFKNCHKISIDPRYQPNRLLCTDRVNGRLVHLTLEGQVIGDYASGLRRPSAVDFYNDLIAVAEISGRVSLLDKKGQVVNTLGTNDIAKEINTNNTAPQAWRPGIFTSPHGIAFDKNGHLYVTEWNKWGRILKFEPAKEK